MVYCSRRIAGRLHLLQAFVLTVAVLCCRPVAAASFDFLNITDLPGGPGQGTAPSINVQGNIAFQQGTAVYVYDQSDGTFLNVTALQGAPAGARLPKLNNLGNIAMIEATTKDVWFFEASTQIFTNVSALVGYPGNSQVIDLSTAFDLNDNNKISFHSGDNNLGTIHVYDHASGTFTEITGLGGGPSRGRQNVINSSDQVAYMGFPSVILYDPGTGTATDINNLPGGPGGLSNDFALNDLGDVAIFSPDDVVFFDASTGSFLFLSTLPGWPIGSASSNANDLSNGGGITFWRTDIHHFDPTDQSFTQLNNQGSVPAGGLASRINGSGQVAFTAGSVGGEDIFLARPSLGNVPAVSEWGMIVMSLLLLTAASVMLTWRGRQSEEFQRW